MDAAMMLPMIEADTHTPTAEQCREQARHIRHQAELTLGNPWLRDEMLERAAEFDRLADSIERVRFK
jgi:hypothetical protein